MNLIEEITKRNTGEYTIRSFIESDVQRTLSIMEKWSRNSNKHIRRLASEGGRPRLPWAKKLNRFVENPLPLIPILNNLKDDSSKYVQKSVANCLNDILKDNPEIGIQIIEDWNKGNVTKQRQWIIKHSLRNLLKKDDEWAKEIIK
jgi:3-methyladenine DNA glycosylase AlkC